MFQIAIDSPFRHSTLDRRNDIPPIVLYIELSGVPPNENTWLFVTGYRSWRNPLENVAGTRCDSQRNLQTAESTRTADLHAAGGHYCMHIRFARDLVKVCTLVRILRLGVSGERSSFGFEDTSKVLTIIIRDIGVLPH